MPHRHEPSADHAHATGDERRSLVSVGSTAAMFAGLVGGYGLLAGVFGRFLYPRTGPMMRRLFVMRVADIEPGESLLYRTPEGRTVNITRTSRTGAVEDFIALSSTCPHLGCQVHWEAQNNRYFCPCHNGTFDASGKGTGGPPGDAGLSLPRYPLVVEGGLLYIELPPEGLTTNGRTTGQVLERVASVEGPGHDPCLGAHIEPRFEVRRRG